VGYDVRTMIRKTVYFRSQEDLDKFNALPNKAEWLHDHLSSSYIIGYTKPNVYVNKLEGDSISGSDTNPATLTDDPTYTEAEDIA